MQRNTILYSIIFLAQKDVKKDEHKIKHRWAETGGDDSVTRCTYRLARPVL